MGGCGALTYRLAMVGKAANRVLYRRAVVDYGAVEFGALETIHGLPADHVVIEVLGH